MTISDEVREALVAVYGMVPQCPVPRSDATKVRFALAKELFGRSFTDKEDLDQFLDGRERYGRHNHLNRYLMEATGVGHTLFTVTSLSHPDIETDSATTLLAFDQAHFSEFEATIAESSGSEPKPYRESLYFLWTRSLLDGELVYGFLSAAGPYLWDALEDALFAWVDEAFPVTPRKVETPDALAEEIDRQLNRPEAEEKKRFDACAAGSRLIKTMLDDEGRDRMFERDDPWVRRRLTDDGHEIREDIVFSNAGAMEKVRFGSFHADVASLPDGSERFEARIAELVEEFRLRLKELAFAPKTSVDG
ncbi:hypothetical protein OIU34_20165 [Pararhizobium sp. BT-229]|uniref:hypothetical protein n=1 Tax=Pararhizobium sp. BT-229 TaxID=2986923 RepID=UPI0021F6FD27|nr:hypothetical protein [Pararhizobium sp. BT-229]MCV9964203.1 hypothetical protein [Pararhizobium sp. BT-229]